MNERSIFSESNGTRRNALNDEYPTPMVETGSKNYL